MAVEFVGVGTEAAGSSSISVGLPAGASDGDLLVLHVHCSAAQSVTLPSGWTSIGDHAFSTSSFVTRVTLAYAVYDSGYYYYYFDLQLWETNGVGVSLNSMDWAWYDQYGNLLNQQGNGPSDIASWFDLPGAYLPGGGYVENSFYFWSSSPEPIRCSIMMSGYDDSAHYTSASDEYWGYGPN